MKILITGGLGNLGSWLTEKLVNEGHQVTVLASRKRKVLLNLDFQFIQCDITDKEAVLNCLKNSHFEAVIHAASSNEFFEDGYDNQSLLVNGYGTRNLVDCFSGNTNIKHFIYLSTFHVYGASEGVITESSPIEPRNDYAITHLFGEEYVKYFHRTEGLPFTIIRLSNSYGAPKELDSSKWYLVLNDLAKTAYEKKEILIKSNGKANRDFIWMGDVCSVFADLVNLNEATNDVYNLSSGRNYEVLDVAKSVASAYKSKFREELPIRVNFEDKNEYKTVTVDSSKIQKLIPYSRSNKFEEEAIKIFNILDQKK